MPQIDLRSTPGALPAGALPALADRLAADLLRHRGVPDGPAARANVWLTTAEDLAFVGGAAPRAPHVLVDVTVIAGGLDDDGRAGVLADATAAVRAVAPDAEVWVRCHDVPEGAWGAGGVAVDLGASQALLGAS